MKERDHSLDHNLLANYITWEIYQRKERTNTAAQQTRDLGDPVIDDAIYYNFLWQQPNPQISCDDRNLSLDSARDEP